MKAKHPGGCVFTSKDKLEPAGEIPDETCHILILSAPRCHPERREEGGMRGTLLGTRYLLLVKQMHDKELLYTVQMNICKHSNLNFLIRHILL